MNKKSDQKTRENALKKINKLNKVSKVNKTKVPSKNEQEKKIKISGKK